MSYFTELYIEMIDKWMETWKIDLVELGNNCIRGSAEGESYRDLRPWSCSCAGILSPEEEMEWHVSHIKMCLTSWDETYSFFKKFSTFIEKKSKQFREKKKEPAIERIKSEDVSGFCFDYMKHAVPILNCTNSKQITQKEEEIIKEVKKLFSEAQKTDEVQRKKQEEENERLRKEEEAKLQKQQEKWNKQQEKIQEETEFLRLSSLILDSQDLVALENNYQTVKNNPFYSANKKTFENDNKATLDLYYNSKKGTFVVEHSNNNEKNENLNNLKTTFHKIYQKGKKYTFSELHYLQEIIRLIEKEVSLDNSLQEAWKELRSIFSKLEPCEREVCFLRCGGENVNDMLKDLDNYYLESLKKAFEEMDKIICLSEHDKYLLESINNKLKTIKLGSEIKELESQKLDNPQQQSENQQKIEQKKKKELEKTKEEQKKRVDDLPPKTLQNEEILKNRAYEQILAEIEDLKKQNNQSELTKKINQIKEVFKILEKEINQLKTEIEELKKENDNTPEYKAYLSKKESELKDKEYKLEQLRGIIKTDNNENKPKSNNFPIGLVVGGGIGLLVVGLIGVLIIRNKRKQKMKIDNSAKKTRIRSS